jgi:hypothetical protein
MAFRGLLALALALPLAAQPDPAMLRRLFEDALARCRHDYGNADAHTAQAARDLGLFLGRQGEASAARSALSEAIQIDEAALGPSARQTLADAAVFYLNGSTLMSVEVKADGREFEAGLPKVLFDTILTSNITRNRYAASRDGQRFLMVTMTKDQVHPEIHVLLNWEAALRR